MFHAFTPLGVALLLEVQDRAAKDPELSILDLLESMVQERPALPLDLGAQLSQKINGFQMLCAPAQGTANLFLGLALPDGQLFLVPSEVSLAKLELALTCPVEEIAVAMAQAMAKQWDRVQAACKAQERAGGTSALLDANGHSQALQKPSDAL